MCGNSRLPGLRWSKPSLGHYMIPALVRAGQSGSVASPLQSLEDSKKDHVGTVLGDLHG